MTEQKQYKSIEQINAELLVQCKAELEEITIEAEKRARNANIFSDYYKVTHGLPTDW